MSLLCLWCDSPLPGPLALRICTSCAPAGDHVHQCHVPGHGGTFGVEFCGECRENERREARFQAEVAPQIAQLREIRAGLVAELQKPWPGCNFGKAILGRAIDGAISDLEAQRCW